MIRVLFVCAGNICRSPLAEGVFIHKINERGLNNHFKVDSAGTGAWHVGQRPDVRSQKVGEKHGIYLPGHSRQFILTDFKDFDLILAMDNANYQDLKQMADTGDLVKLKMMRDFDTPGSKGKSVPDPYYGGNNGFDIMYSMLNTCCENLLKELADQVQSQ